MDPSAGAGSSQEEVDYEICTSADIVCSNDCLLSEILASLPLSSLRLFKSVCRGWLSLITHPALNALRSRSPRADHPRGLFLQLEKASSEFAYVPLGAPKRSPPLMTTSFPFYPSSSIDFYPRNSRYIEVLQSCNGLLLCQDRPDKFYVYNPTINQFKLLPLPHIWKPDGVLRYMALAFDPTLSPHYKILYPSEDFTRPGRRVHVEIYSSETGGWSACAHTFSLASFTTFDGRVVYWRGAIHWLSRLRVYHFSLQDIDNPHFVQVEENHTTLLYGIKYGANDNLFVSRDCLLLVRMLPPPLQVNVYEMKNDYHSGWCLKYHVDLESAATFPGPRFHVLSLVLGETEEDSFLVLEVTTGTTALIQYNIISKTFHQLCDLSQFRLRPTQFCSYLYTPSLAAV